MQEPRSFQITLIRLADSWDLEPIDQGMDSVRQKGRKPAGRTGLWRTVWNLERERWKKILKTRLNPVKEKREGKEADRGEEYQFPSIRSTLTCRERMHVVN